MKLYGKLAKYYDLLQNIDYAKEAEVCKLILKNFEKYTGSLLDVGCGTGSHMLEFKKLGYEVYGLDSSKKMLDLAKKKLPSAIFYKARMEWMLLFRKFDVITLLSRTALLVRNEWYLKQLIKNIYNHLKNEGVLILDIDVHEWNFNEEFNKINHFKYGNVQGSLSESYELKKNKILWSINLSIHDNKIIRAVEAEEYLLLNVHNLLRIMRGAGFKVQAFTNTGRKTDNYKQSLLIAGIKSKE